jgi:hypothetical protein
MMITIPAPHGYNTSHKEEEDKKTKTKFDW